MVRCTTVLLSLSEVYLKVFNLYTPPLSLRAFANNLTDAVDQLLMLYMSSVEKVSSDPFEAVISTMYIHGMTDCLLIII